MSKQKKAFEKAIISDIDGVVVPYIYDEPGAKEKTPEFLAKLEALHPIADIVKIYINFHKNGYVFYFVTGRASDVDQITRIHLGAFCFKYKLKHTPYKNAEQYINDKIIEIEKIVKKYKKVVIIDDDISIYNAVLKNIVAKYPKKRITLILYPNQIDELERI